MSTSPFLNISTNVSYSANRNSWSDESCQGHCSIPATWCCMPNVLRKAKFGKIVEYIDHAYLVARMSIQNQWMMPIITYEIGVLIKNLITIGSTIDGLSSAQAATGFNVSSVGKIFRDKSTAVCHRNFFLWMSCSSLCPCHRCESQYSCQCLESGTIWTLENWLWVMLQVMIAKRTVILNSHSITKMGSSNVHQVHGSYLTTNLLLIKNLVTPINN